MLDQEYYLSKILGHLVDYGLQECRRVCRKWRQVCNKLPVKLNGVRFDEVRILAERFPNAAKWDMERYPAVSLYPDREKQRHIPQAEEMETCLLYLPRFKNLKHLKFEFISLKKDANRWSPLFEELGESFQTLEKLTSLEIVVDCEEDDSLCFASQLRYLTNLTSLEMQLKPCGLPIEPFTELQKIERLDVPDYLVTQDQRLMFPELTNLTHLRWTDRYKTSVAQYKRGVLEVSIESKF